MCSSCTHSSNVHGLFDVRTSSRATPTRELPSFTSKCMGWSLQCPSFKRIMLPGADCCWKPILCLIPNGCCCFFCIWGQCPIDPRWHKRRLAFATQEGFARGHWIRPKRRQQSPDIIGQVSWPASHALTGTTKPMRQAHHLTSRGSFSESDSSSSD